MTTAPTDRYICANCGYIYVPGLGDPMNAIRAGIPFEGLPEEWVCPMCYATKSHFDPVD